MDFFCQVTSFLLTWFPGLQAIAKSTISGGRGGAASNNLKRKSISFEGGDQVKKALKAPTSSMGNNKKRTLGNNKVYAPPQGKYSSNLGKVGKYLEKTLKYYIICCFSLLFEAILTLSKLDLCTGLCIFYALQWHAYLGYARVGYIF